MKKIFFLAITGLLYTNSFAQKNTNKIGIGINYMSLDMPDDVVWMPRLNYEYQFGKRLFVSTQIGGVNYKGRDDNFNVIAEHRRRFTSDLTAKFVILKYKNNYLKIGIGPSLWHRNDDVVSRVKIKADAPDFIPEIVSYDMINNKGWNLGYNINTELDINISTKISIIGSFGVANLGKSGFSSILGSNVYYKF
jgi:hypothetical protein